MTTKVPNVKPASDDESYRALASSVNQNAAETQPFYVRRVSAPFTADERYGVYAIDTVSYGSTMTVQVPYAKAHNSRRFTFKKIDGGHHIHITPQSGDTVDLGSVITLTTSGDYVTLCSDGVSDWMKIG